MSLYRLFVAIFTLLCALLLSANTYAQTSGDFNAAWINELSDDVEYTIGCDTNKFCPQEPVTREWFNTLLSQLP